jgi:hypothetical protein
MSPSAQPSRDHKLEKRGGKLKREEAASITELVPSTQ